MLKYLNKVIDTLTSHSLRTRYARMSKKREGFVFDTNDKPPPPDPLLQGSIKTAYDNMSSEEKERYRKIGEQMYGNIDFETGEIKQEVDCISDIMSAVKSGLHPWELTNEELGFMCSSLGAKWYEKFGYTKEEIDAKQKHISEQPSESSDVEKNKIENIMNILMKKSGTQ